MLTDIQQTLSHTFYECLNRSGHNNGHLNSKTKLPVSLAAACAMNCTTFSAYTLSQAQKAKISRGALQKVLAKVMAVAAVQKRLQASEGGQV